jgi:hypothetical protein
VFGSCLRPDIHFWGAGSIARFAKRNSKQSTACSVLGGEAAGRPEVAFVDAQYYSSSVEPDGHAFYVTVKRGDNWLIRVTRTARFVPSSR